MIFTQREFVLLKIWKEVSDVISKGDYCFRWRTHLLLISLAKPTLEVPPAPGSSCFVNELCAGQTRHQLILTLKRSHIKMKIAPEKGIIDGYALT